MKKFIIILIFLFPFISNAQSGKISIGFNTGASFSKINLDDNTFIRYDDNYYGLLYAPDNKADIKSNVLTGIDVQYFISNKLSLQSGLQYTAKGIKYYYDQDIQVLDQYGQIVGSYDLKYEMISNYEYLQIPLLIQYSIGNKFQFTALAGLSASFLINKYYGIETEQSGNYKVSIYSQDIKTNNIISSVILGSILTYHVSDKFSYKLDFRYNHDLTKIYNYADDELITVEKSYGDEYKVAPFGIDADSKFRSVSISIGIAYNLN